jgi:hypothetical protein
MEEKDDEAGEAFGMAGKELRLSPTRTAHRMHTVRAHSPPTHLLEHAMAVYGICQPATEPRRATRRDSWWWTSSAASHSCPASGCRMGPQAAYAPDEARQFVRMRTSPQVA